MRATMKSCALFIAAALGAATTCFGEDIKLSRSVARPSMPYTGTATMLEDGSLSLHLRLTDDGKPINETLTYKTTDRGYDDVLRHLGGLGPGDTKSFSPWKD